MGEFTYYTVSTARSFAAMVPGRGFFDWIGDRLLPQPPHLVWPRSTVPTAAVSVRLDEQPGQIVCNEPGAFRKDAVLWISNAAFEAVGYDHEWIEVRVPVGRIEQSGYWRRLTAADIRAGTTVLSSDLAPELALGTLYRRTLELRPAAKIVTLTLLVQEPRAEEVNACLNPLILGFGTGTDTELPADFEVFRDGPHLLDLQPAFSADDLPRARLHAELHRRKSVTGAIGTQAPAVQQLLFGQDPEVGVLPFLMLDALRGTFLLEGLSSGTAKWSWSPPERKLARDNRWLADYCLSRLHLTLMTEVTPGEALACNDSERRARRDRDHRPWLTTDDVGASLEAAQLPGAVVEIARREPELIRQSLMRCLRDGQLYTSAFSEDLGSILLPRSTIRARFPNPPPAWIGEPAIALWSRTRARYQLDLRETPLAAAEWWLKFLDNPTPPHSEATVRWSVGNGWHWPFYASLFRRQPTYRAEWLKPFDPAGLGRPQSPLGRMVLGADTAAANQDFFHGPDRFQLLAPGEE